MEGCIKKKKDLKPKKYFLGKLRVAYLGLTYFLHLRIRLIHDKIYAKGGLYKKWNDLSYSGAIHRAIIAAFILSMLFFTGIQNVVPFAIDYLKLKTAQLQKDFQKKEEVPDPTQSYVRNLKLYVSNFRIERLGVNSVDVSWETSLPESTSIEYKEDVEGSQPKVADFDMNTITTHKATLKDLKPATRYSVRPFIASSIEVDNNPWTQFTTEKLKVDKHSVKANSKSASLYFILNEDAEGQLEYRRNGDGNYIKTEKAKLNHEHTFIINNLEPGAEYEYNLTVFGSEKETFKSTGRFSAQLSDESTFDSVNFSQQELINGKVSLLARWKTKTALTTRVRYMNEAGNWLEAEAGDKAKQHQLKIDNLMPGFVLNYQISGVDTEGLTYFDKSRTEEVLKELVISGVSVRDINEAEVTLGFNTNIETVPEVIIKNIENNTIERMGGLTYSKKHVLSIDSLDADTEYSVTMRATDKYKNQAKPVSTSFKTKEKSNNFSFVAVHYDQYTGADSWSAIITWEITSLARSELFYGTNESDLGRSVEREGLKNVVKIDNLKYGESLYFVIKGKDSGSQSSISKVYSVSSPTKQNIFDRYLLVPLSKVINYISWLLFRK